MNQREFWLDQVSLSSKARHIVHCFEKWARKRAHIIPQSQFCREIVAILHDSTYKVVDKPV